MRSNAAERVRLGDVPDRPVDRIRCAEPWHTVFGGGLAAGSTALIYGPRGIGKTTELVRLAASLGPRVLLACLEMGQDARTLHEVARRTGADARDVWIAQADTLGAICAEVARPPAPRVLLVDSASALARGAEEAALCALRRALPKAAALVCVVHITKAGTMAGAEGLAHACDTIVRLTADEASTEGEKNRYGVLTSSPRVAYRLPPTK